MSPDAGKLRAERERFGGNLRAVREIAGMGQRELAARMAALGRPWHQNTVTRVEAGARDVSFGEVQALAAIFHVPTDRFTLVSAEVHEYNDATEAAFRLEEAFGLAASALLRLHRARSVAEKQAATAQASRYERVRSAAGDITAALERTTVGHAAGEAEARYRYPEDEEDS
jgi:transcriptional regulator with XRE-family HTH domain